MTSIFTPKKWYKAEEKKMDIRQRSLKKHYEWGGKIEVVSRAKIESREDLSLAYTPGVAEPCVVIHNDVSPGS